jgi:hypothetical protein
MAVSRSKSKDRHRKRRNTEESYGLAGLLKATRTGYGMSSCRLSSNGLTTRCKPIRSTRTTSLTPTDLRTRPLRPSNAWGFDVRAVRFQDSRGVVASG